MTLPAAITKATVTFGKSIAALGSEASLVGTVQLDRPVIWAATGDALNTHAEGVESGVGGFLTFQFPHVDQAGFIDEAGNAVTMFAGVLTVKVMYGKVVQRTIVRPFQPLVGQTSIDLDLVESGSITPGVTAPQAAVTSVQGMTGAVDLSATFAPVVRDTGWRMLESGYIGSRPEFGLLIRRTGRTVQASFLGGTSGFSSCPAGTIPAGFRPAAPPLTGQISLPYNTFDPDPPYNALPNSLYMTPDGGFSNTFGSELGDMGGVALIWETDDAWPNPLPGVLDPS